MQGAAGIAAYLFRLARVVETGRDAPAVQRMENWWAVDPVVMMRGPQGVSPLGHFFLGTA